MHELHSNMMLVAIGMATCMHSMDMVLSHALAHAHCLVKSRGFAHLAALGRVSMMLHCGTVTPVNWWTLQRCAR